MSFLGRIAERARALFLFLKVPVAVVLLFGALAVAVYNVDNGLSQGVIERNAVLRFLEKLFGDREATRAVLSTISSALITVTSITFSMLLVAVQQGASSFSSQILDQFLHRRQNQFYFGFFVGVSLFSLVTLATTHRVDHPLFGSLIALTGTFVALCIILALIYTTVEQMRSTNVVSAIAGMVAHARGEEVKLLQATAAVAPEGTSCQFAILADGGGVVNWSKLDGLITAVERYRALGAVVVLKVPGGSFVWRGDPVAQVCARQPLAADAREDVESAVRRCLKLGAVGDPTKNPRAGIRQLSTIGWNSASSARSNPRPPILVCRTLVDLVWQWTERPPERNESSPVIYPDLIIDDCIDAIENIVVAAAEAKQPQTVAEAYRAYARLIPRVGEGHRDQLEEAVRLSLGSLTHHIPTRYLNVSLQQLEAAMKNAGRTTCDRLREVRHDEERAGEFSDTATSLRV